MSTRHAVGFLRAPSIVDPMRSSSQQQRARLRVLHVITSLDRGGAEGVLHRLVVESSAHIHHVVVCLSDLGHFGRLIRSSGTTVYALGMRKNPSDVLAVAALYRIIKRERPDVVQTWLYHSDLLGGVIARWGGVRQVVWGIRNSPLTGDRSRLGTRMVARLCAVLSYFVPTMIISCSERAAREHELRGYRGENMAVIPNGCDLEAFVPDAAARTRIRAESATRRSWWGWWGAGIRKRITPRC